MTAFDTLREAGMNLCRRDGSLFGASVRWDADTGRFTASVTVERHDGALHTVNRSGESVEDAAAVLLRHSMEAQ